MEIFRACFHGQETTSIVPAPTKTNQMIFTFEVRFTPQIKTHVFGLENYVFTTLWLTTGIFSHSSTFEVYLWKFLGLPEANGIGSSGWHKKMLRNEHGPDRVQDMWRLCQEHVVQ